jgi:hypothetical protein
MRLNQRKSIVSSNVVVRSTIGGKGVCVCVSDEGGGGGGSWNVFYRV